MICFNNNLHPSKRIFLLYSWIIRSPNSQPFLKHPKEEIQGIQNTYIPINTLDYCMQQIKTQRKINILPKKPIALSILIDDIEQ